MASGSTRRSIENWMSLTVMGTPSCQLPSRALPVRQHAYANGETPNVGKPPHFRRPRRKRCLNNFYPTYQIYLTAPTSRHSHRSGNPEPCLCANTLMPTGKLQMWSSRPIPSPLPKATPEYLLPDLPDLPSFSPQWESRSLFVCRHARANGETPNVGKPPHPVALVR